jgi:hypothetical protein
VTEFITPGFNQGEKSACFFRGHLREKKFTADFMEKFRGSNGIKKNFCSQTSSSIFLLKTVDNRPRTKSTVNSSPN